MDCEPPRAAALLPEISAQLLAQEIQDSTQTAGVTAGRLLEAPDMPEALGKLALQGHLLPTGKRSQRARPHTQDREQQRFRDRHQVADGDHARPGKLRLRARANAGEHAHRERSQRRPFLAGENHAVIGRLKDGCEDASDMPRCAGGDDTGKAGRGLEITLDLTNDQGCSSKACAPRDERHGPGVDRFLRDAIGMLAQDGDDLCRGRGDSFGWHGGGAQGRTAPAGFPDGLPGLDTVSSSASAVIKDNGHDR